MTREEAIRRLKNMAWLYGNAEREPHIEAIAIAIEALSAPQTDLISRADAIDAVCGDCTIENRESCKRDGYCYEVRNLMALPPADRPRGEWLEEKGANWFGGGAWKCSNCEYGYSFSGYHEANEFNYCPNCGARMEGDE